jgi:hypothetical protein
MFRNGQRLSLPLVDPGYAANPSDLLWQYGLYLLSTLALFVIYGLVLFYWHRGELSRGPPKAFALGFPVLFNLILIPGLPHLSQDIFSYMAHGYLGLSPDGNPFLSPASAIGGTANGRQLAAYGWRPDTGIGITPYGVLWTRLEMTAVGAVSSVYTAMLLLKALVVVASLGGAY